MDHSAAVPPPAAEHDAREHGTRDLDARDDESRPWQDLPGPIDPATMVESVAAIDPMDPRAGRDPDHEWMMRHG